MLPILLGSLIALAWLPVLLKFLRSWRERRNPISLAICLIVVLAAYVPVWVASDQIHPWSWLGVLVVDSIVCGFFYVAVAWSDRHFRSDRRSRNN